MDWTPLTSAIVQGIVAPALLAAAAYFVSRLPGPIRDALASAVHARDVALVGGAMDRRASAIAAGGITTASPAMDLASYVRLTLPEVVAKLAPSDEALRTMALAAMQRALAEAAAAAQAPRPPGVASAPGGL